MMEVVFGRSIAASMALAMSCGSCIDDPAREREEECWNWGNAVPMTGAKDDLFEFPLALSVGSIGEKGIGPERLEALQHLNSLFPELRAEAAGQIDACCRRLEELLCRAQAGEPIRIWTSDNPDEACGLYWMIRQLDAVDVQNPQVTVVRLPRYEILPDGDVVRENAWGDVPPYRLGHLAQQGEPLSGNLLGAVAMQWWQLQSENAPLRVVLNGRIVSVSEDAYDLFLFRELEDREDDFSEASLIGDVLGKYQLGIGDSWLALRVEKLIADGILEVLDNPDPEGFLYRRRLRRKK